MDPKSAPLPVDVHELATQMAQQEIIEALWEISNHLDTLQMTAFSPFTALLV